MVLKGIVATFTLVCFCVYLQGCYSNRLIPPQELEQNPDYRIAKVPQDSS